MFPILSPFQNEWITFLAFLAGIFFLIGLSEIARSKLKWTPEASRKFVHVLVGVLVMFSPFLFVSNLPPIVLAAIFIVVNAVALKSKKFEGMHATDRVSYGTVYFPAAYLLLCLFWWEQPVVFEISLLLMTFADTAAAVAGGRAKSPESYTVWRDTKTVQGSVVMFIVSILLIGLGTRVFQGLAHVPPIDLKILLPLSLFVAALVTVAEATSSAGSDNVTIPIVAAVGYDLFLTTAQNGETVILLLWILVSFAIAIGAMKLDAVSTNGALGAFFMGLFVFGIGGWRFTIPIVVFFVLSSLLSKMGQRRKKALKAVITNGSRRDIVQVFANGGIPMLLAVWWFYQPSQWLYAGYLASVAAATADTWETEIGFFSKWAPRNSVTLAKMESGASGGITLLGTLGGLLGSTVIAAVAYPFLPDPAILKWVIIAGLVGSFIDSFLGATVQGLYQCDECGMTTETASHCNGPISLIRGTGYISNDVVNLLCTLSGGAIVLLMI